MQWSSRSLWLLPLLAAAAVTPAFAQIVVYHTTTSVEKGTTRQFTAYVPLSPNTITWKVNGVVGGNATVGTVTQAGLYAAPGVIPTNNVVYVQATSTAYPNITGAATVTITQPKPWVWSVSPSAPAAGASVTLSLNGSAFINGATVLVNGTAWPTTYVSSTSLRATGIFPAAGTYAITVSHPNPGGIVSQAVNVNVGAAAPITVTVSPTTATVTVGTTRQFTANVAVTWTATAGTINASGLYTAPASMPASNSVTIRATSTQDTTKFAQATVTLQAAASPVTISPPSATVSLGATQQFTSNTALVTWTATAGSISTSGLFTAPGAMPASPTVAVRATSTADSSQFAQATVTLQSPAPAPVSPAYLSAARLLEQAAFGPTQQGIADVMQKGVNTWLDEQFAMPETAIAEPSAMSAVSAQTLSRLVTAQDQLRQRAAWALGGVIVISGNKNIYPPEYVPYLRLLSKHAFGNYRDLLRDITLSPQMGKYLDLANSNKPGVGGGANENYPRELLQLFTIGLVQLNPDGSTKLDGAGRPILTYTQADVRQFALALTGWTYPTAAGAQPASNNWENFSQPQMEPRLNNHDTSAKTLLNGTVLPAGQSPQQDLEGVLDNLFQHPNMGPFLATRMIRAMVASNPSPAYIQRVAQVFNNNGAGIRGDLRAVVRAILTDTEARNDEAGTNSGRLKDPIYSYVSFIRAMGGTIQPTTQMSYIFATMSMPLSSPPSVFGYYSPMYRVPYNPTLFGPEFQVYTPTTAVILGNEIYRILGSPNGDPSVDLSPFQAAAGNISTLLDTVNQRLFYGRMSTAVRTSMQTALQAAYDNNQRVTAALYLAFLSGQYAVQY